MTGVIYCHYVLSNEKILKNAVCVFQVLSVFVLCHFINPHCLAAVQLCGKPMSMNLRADHTFVEDEGWHDASERYADFLRGCRKKKVLFLEAAVGFNTPTIVKYSFWRMVSEWKDAVYA